MGVGRHSLALAGTACLAASTIGAAWGSADAKPRVSVSGGRVTIPTPPPGRAVFGVFKEHTTRRKGVAIAAKPYSIRLANPKAAPGVVVIAAVHTTRTAHSATRTVVFGAFNTGSRRIASLATPKGDIDQQEMDAAMADMTLYLTGVWVGDDPMFRYDREQGKSDDAVEQLEAAVDGRGPAQETTAKLRFESLFKTPEAWTPTGTIDSSIDTGWYDDGHAFGWKLKKQELPQHLLELTDPKVSWGKLVATMEQELATDGPGAGGTGAPPATGDYTCSGPNNLLFDNWNTDVVANGGSSPTFDTGGKAYCINTLATYHWNGSKGARPGSISILQGGKTIATWKAVGQAPDGSPGNVNWVANIPQGSAPVVVQGSFSCKDSAPATWAQNATSKHAGFCRVWGQVATKNP